MTPKIAQIIDLFPGHIYWKDRNGVYLGCNEEQAKALGLSSSQEIIGKTDLDLVWSYHAQELRAVDQEVMNSGEGKITEENLILANGSQMTVISKKTPLLDEQGEIIGVIGTSVDISELKKKEADLIEAKEKSEAANIAKTNFLAMMSHEFRTPLNGILGMLEILQQKEKPDFFEEYLKPIKISANHLLSLVHDLLLFSHLEVGSVKIERLVFALKELFNEVVLAFFPKAMESAIQFNKEYDAALPVYVYGDPLRLKQVLINLVENAFKYTPKGSVTLRFRRENRNLRIEVQDTGLGVSAEKQDKIFKPFTQLETSYTRKAGGVGLGLSICKDLVVKMGGKIGLESEVGKGSTFWFTLPLELASEPFVDPAPEEKITTPIAPQHILLVEDNLINQKVAKSLLETLSCTCDVAGTGKEALDFSKRNQYDLILMDIGLPDIDGMTVAKKIRENNADVKIVALTAYAFGQDLHGFLAGGMNDVLIKPISFEKLKRVLLPKGTP